MNEPTSTLDISALSLFVVLILVDHDNNKVL